MKKAAVFLVVAVLALSLFGGCSNDSAQTPTDTSSARVKDEVELVLEKTAWRMEGESFYLLFTDNKHATVYDLTQLDGSNQEVGKYLSYEVSTDDKGVKTITIGYLLKDQDKTVFTYNQETKSFNTQDGKSSLKSVAVKTFVQAFMKQIETVETTVGSKWDTQAKMNEGSGVLCCYWNALHEAMKEHVKGIVTAEEYETFTQENKVFETARDQAVQAAGKEAEGGTMYASVVNGAYCTETKKQIETILTKYYQ